LIGKKERQTENQDSDADLVQPVGAQHLLEIKAGAMRALINMRLCVREGRGEWRRLSPGRRRR
jgi:hypothetical protein